MIQKGLAGVTALKEKLLLSFGIVCILFGAIGVCAVGAAYYYTDSALNELPNDIEQLYAVTNQTTNDAKMTLWYASYSVMIAADDLEDIGYNDIPLLYFVILGPRPFRNIANSLRKTAASGMQLGGDFKMVSEFLGEGKEILLDEISSIRLTAQVTFGWIGVLQVLFIIIGVSLLQIRKSLLRVINMNKT